MIEFRPGSILRRGRPRLVRPPKDVIDVVHTWLRQAPKLNDDERKIAATTIKYLITPPVIVDFEQNSL